MSAPHTGPVLNPDPPVPTLTVLLVCTGNICRSALAERLGRAYLDEVLGDDTGAIRLVSAGTQAVVGSGMHPDSALVLQGFGGNPGDFQARQLTEAIAAEADLTLAMTRTHRKQVLKLAPRGLARTFTLREAADLVGLLPEDVELPGEDLPERATALAKAMADARSRRDSTPDADDVPDPIGLPLEAHEEAGQLIAAALIPVLDRIVALHTGEQVTPPPEEQPAAHAAPTVSRDSVWENTARISPAI